MGTIMGRPVTKTAKRPHHVRKDPGWQNKHGYRTPSKEELDRTRKKELKRTEEQRKQQETPERGIVDRFIDWILRRK